MSEISNIYVNTEATQRFNESLQSLLAAHVGDFATETFMHRKNLFLADLILDLNTCDTQDGVSLLPYASPIVTGPTVPGAAKAMFEALDASFFLVASAVRYNNHVFFCLPKARHAEVGRALYEKVGERIKRTLLEEGFLAVGKEGQWTFKNRKQAYMEACFNGQLRRRHGPQHYQGDDLYSEDLF